MIYCSSLTTLFMKNLPYALESSEMENLFLIAHVLSRRSGVATGLFLAAGIRYGDKDYFASGVLSIERKQQTSCELSEVLKAQGPFLFHL